MQAAFWEAQLFWFHSPNSCPTRHALALMHLISKKRNLGF